MLKQLLAQRWFMIVAAGLVVVGLLSMFVEVQLPGDWDRRPRGSVEDIAKIRDRDDVNVLFILIDTLRAERLSSYGYDRETSPVLDRLAESGVRFERVLAQSTWTKSSMVSLWTGLYPVRTGVDSFEHVIPDQARMAAEFLREAGFKTVGLWRNGWVSSTFGFDQGFDVYIRPGSPPMSAKLRRENPTLKEKSTDEGVIQAAREFLRTEGKQRWFLYFHFMDLHEYIYDAESALFGNTYSDIYDNSIRWTDGTIGLFLEMLADLGHLENTLIVIASDHGEAFAERGFEGHARRVFRESTEVPLLLSLPFRLEPGVVVKTRAQNVDIWPTILDLLGLGPMEGVDGRSLVPDILASASGQTPEDDGRIAFSDLNQHWGKRDSDTLSTLAVVDGSFRYVRVEHAGRPSTEILFDANGDPREVRDRAEEEPEIFERLRATAADYYESQLSWGAPPTREVDEMELNLLRALGYKIE